MTNPLTAAVARAREARKKYGIITDIERVLALPVQEFDGEEAAEWTRRLRRHPLAPPLKPVQGQVLEALHRAPTPRGGLFPLAVGAGKTLICELAATVMNAQRPLLLIPPALRGQHARDRAKWQEHYAYTPPRVLAYSALSQPSASGLLEEIAPTLIIADEVHALKASGSARVRRVLRYFRAHPDTRFVGLSGTITGRSLLDYCLAPGMRVLTSDLRWVPIEDLTVGQELVGFDETLSRSCKLKPSVVEGVKVLQKRRLRITTTRGTVVCSADHGWVRCAYPHTPIFAPDVYPPVPGKLPRNVQRTHRGERAASSPFQALVTAKGVRYEGPVRATMEEAARDAAELRAKHNPRLYDEQGNARVRSQGRVTKHWAQAKDLEVGQEIAFYVEPWGYDATREGGYVAGLLDGEGWVCRPSGNYVGGIVGFAQKPGPVLDAYCEGLARRGFTFSKHERKGGVVIVLPTGEAPSLRLLGMFRPLRLLKKSRMCWEGKQYWGKNSEKATILKIEDLGAGPVVAVQTSTKTFIAEGFLSHNCHLLELALRDGSPMPLSRKAVEQWASVVDVKGEPDFNALEALWPLVVRHQGQAKAEALRQEGFAPRRTAAREGYRDRLHATPGIVATSASSCDATLVLSYRRPRLPVVVSEALTRLQDTWTSPDGTEISDAPQQHALACQLSAGFYYTWATPPDLGWLEARQGWARALRHALRYASRQGHDSPALVARACQRGEGPPERLEAWRRWAVVKDIPEPPRVAVWLDEYLVDDAVRWAKGRRALLWYHHQAVGEKLAACGVPVFGAGSDAPPNTLDVAALSIPVHSKGKNLQAWCDQLVIEPPSSGATWEQCLDAQTEILTDHGWLGIDAPWRGDAQIAAYDLSDGSIRWSGGRRMERLLGDEKMFGISNPHLDIRVTGGHRIVHGKLRRRGPNGRDGHYYDTFQFVRADALPCRGRVPVAGVQEVPGLPLTDEELVFIGLVMSGGYVNPKTKLIEVHQSDRYPEMVQLFRDTLDQCGFGYGHSINMRPSNFGPRKHALHRWCISFNGPKQKGHGRGWRSLAAYIDRTFADALEGISKDQLYLLLRGLWAGNGAKTRGTYDYDKYTPHTLTVSFGNARVAEKLQALCVRRGFRCSLTQPGESTWLLYISEDTSWTVARMAIKDGRPTWKELPSSPVERVWCVEVDTGAIVTRRNGKVAVVGNCLGRTHRQGQEADEVAATIYGHTWAFRGAMESALLQAQYVVQTTGQVQKLCLANWVL